MGIKIIVMVITILRFLGLAFGCTIDVCYEVIGTDHSDKVFFKDSSGELVLVDLPFTYSFRSNFGHHVYLGAQVPGNEFIKVSIFANGDEFQSSNAPTFASVKVTLSYREW